MYIHKKTLFLDSLAFILQWSLNRPELCQGGLTCNDSLDAKAMALFSLKYTIPCVQSLKDIQLLSEDDWGTFLEEAGKKSTSTSKLIIKEKLVGFFFCDIIHSATLLKS